MAARVSRTTGFVLIAYAFLVTMLGATLPTPLYPLFSQRYSLGELMVTVIFAAYAFGVIAGLLAFGELSDVIGRKPVLLAGLVLAAVSAFLFVFADSLVPIFAGRVISSAPGAGERPAAAISPAPAASERAGGSARGLCARCGGRLWKLCRRGRLQRGCAGLSR